MRRLPVYLLIDTSGSMSGEPITAVSNGVQNLVATLRQDPSALEAAYLSIITFSDRAEQIVPLTEISQFQIPSFTASGTTSMGAALTLLSNRISTEITKTTVEQKGDWKPICFLFTDGNPTDDPTPGIEAIKKSKIGSFVACAAGPGADTSILKSITESVLHLDTADSNTIKAFFKWVSASIATTSKKVDLSKSEVSGLSDLPPPPPEINIVL